MYVGISYFGFESRNLVPVVDMFMVMGYISTFFLGLFLFDMSESQPFPIEHVYIYKNNWILTSLIVDRCVPLGY